MSKERREAIRIAKELRYGAATIERLANAATENEILNILVDARRNARNYN